MASQQWPFLCDFPPFAEQPREAHRGCLGSSAVSIGGSASWSYYIPEDPSNSTTQYKSMLKIMYFLSFLSFPLVPHTQSSAPSVATTSALMMQHSWVSSMHQPAPVASSLLSLLQWQSLYIWWPHPPSVSSLASSSLLSHLFLEAAHHVHTLPIMPTPPRSQDHTETLSTHPVGLGHCFLSWYLNTLALPSGDILFCPSCVEGLVIEYTWPAPNCVLVQELGPYFAT